MIAFRRVQYPSVPEPIEASDAEPAYANQRPFYVLLLDRAWTQVAWSHNGALRIFSMLLSAT